MDALANSPDPVEQALFNAYVAIVELERVLVGLPEGRARDLWRDMIRLEKEVTRVGHRWTEAADPSCV